MFTFRKTWFASILFLVFVLQKSVFLSLPNQMELIQHFSGSRRKHMAVSYIMASQIDVFPFLFPLKNLDDLALKCFHEIFVCCHLTCVVSSIYVLPSQPPRRDLWTQWHTPRPFPSKKNKQRVFRDATMAPQIRWWWWRWWRWWDDDYDQHQILTNYWNFETFAVLPRQRLWSLTAGLDALDLVAIHDEFILLTDLHVMLKFAVHGVVPHNFTNMCSLPHSNACDAVNQAVAQPWLVDPRRVKGYNFTGLQAYGIVWISNKIHKKDRYLQISNPFKPQNNSDGHGIEIHLVGWNQGKDYSHSLQTSCFIWYAKYSASVDISTTPTTSNLVPKRFWSQMAWHPNQTKNGPSLMMALKISWLMDEIWWSSFAGCPNVMGNLSTNRSNVCLYLPSPSENQTRVTRFQENLEKTIQDLTISWYALW